MRLNRSVGYGLMAVAYVALHSKDGLVMASKVAKAYNIPLEYLLKIMQQLVRANVLRSKRGPRGGFSLSRPPKKITLLQVIEAVDGPMVSNLHLDEHARGEKFSARAEQVYAKAIAQAKNVFEKAKLSDLVQR